MKRKSYRVLGALAVAVACSFGASMWLHAQQAGGAIALDPDDIGGVVTSAKGPEAGVWVIAETNELETRFIRIVVTDDQGRYVVPDLPRAKSYQLFVRGYGLVDSPRVTAGVGQRVDLKAVIAPDGKAAAQVYPANYWFSMLQVPSGQLTQAEVASTIKNCLQCHQIGSRATREIPEVLSTLKTGLEKWDRRVSTGPSGANMFATFKRLGEQRAAFATWTDAIAKGAFPKQAPPRPTGAERNLVVSLWDWGSPVTFTHTHAASDRRNPTVNANGRIYGPDRTLGTLMWVNPIENTVGQAKIPVREALPSSKAPASMYWGDQEISGSGESAPRSGVMDQQGRVWMAATIRKAESQPAYCKPGSKNKFAQYFPMERGNKQVAMFDPKSEKFTTVDTCFTTDHNDFGEEADNPLYFGQNGSFGWISSTVFDKSGNEETAQGWCPGVLDTNGDGRITRGWTEPDQPIDPTKDHRIQFGCYSISVHKDGGVWCSGIGGTNLLTRLERGSNPPETCKAEVFLPPTGSNPPIGGAGGVEVDSQGVAWQNWRASDHVTSFDRRKCKGPLNGPKAATGEHCPEGWTIYRKSDLPTLGSMPYHADLNYLIMVDRHDFTGLGKDTPIVYPNNSDALLALTPSRQWVTMRVPYPLGFYTRNAHGRIDDAKTGWKGKALWSTVMTYAVWHIEGEPTTMGGKGQKAKVAKFQFRPNPLAK